MIFEETQQWVSFYISHIFCIFCEKLGPRLLCTARKSPSGMIMSKEGVRGLERTTEAKTPFLAYLG